METFRLAWSLPARPATIALVTGGWVFAPLVDSLARLGFHTMVISIPSATDRRLREAAHTWMSIDEIPRVWR